MAKLSNTKIISCSNEKAIKLWNIETSACLKNLKGTIKNIYGSYGIFE